MNFKGSWLGYLFVIPLANKNNWQTSYKLSLYRTKAESCSSQSAQRKSLQECLCGSVKPAQPEVMSSTCSQGLGISAGHLKNYSVFQTSKPELEAEIFTINVICTFLHKTKTTTELTLSLVSYESRSGQARIISRKCSGSTHAGFCFNHHNGHSSPTTYKKPNKIFSPSQAQLPFPPSQISELFYNEYLHRCDHKFIYVKRYLQAYG